MKLNSLFMAILATSILFSCGEKTENESKTDTKTDTSEESEKEENMEKSDLKDLVMKGMNAFFRDYDEEGVKKYYAEDYIQHNPHVPTGIEPVLGFLPALKKAGTTFRTHRILQDEDMVIMHNTYDKAEAFGAKEVLTFDIFRVENDKIAEHWDCLQAFDPKAKNGSGHTLIDGSTEITDLDKTEVNKKLVEDFYNKVFVEGKKEEAKNYISAETYIQHGAGGKDGLKSLESFLDAYITDSYTPAKIHRVLGEGNFVLIQAESVENGKSSASYDLFRVENDKIVEHWDVIQEIPEKMAHENGMF